MALVNYLFPGTFLMIEALEYSAPTKTMSATLRVYRSREDVRPGNEIFSHVEIAAGKNDIPALASHVPRITPPEEGSFDPSHLFLIAQGAEGAWEGLDGLMTKFNAETGRWDVWPLPTHMRFFCADDGKYWEYSEWMEDKWHPCQEVNDLRIWSQFFAPSVVYAPGNSLRKQAHKWLLSMDKYAGCVEVEDIDYYPKEAGEHAEGSTD